MDRELSMKIVAPLLSIDEATVLCISTIDQKNNYNEMMERMCDDGHPLFRQYEFSFICNACQAVGAQTCKHMALRLPRWQSERKQMMVKAWMQGSEDDYAREALGMTPKQNNQTFDPMRVDDLFALAPYSHGSRALRRVFICIDPNSGTHDASSKASSDFAMISAYEWMEDTLVICGMESIDSHVPDDHVPNMLQHIHALSKRPCMFDSTFVFIIENNLGQEADWLADRIMSLSIPNRRVIMREKDLKSGVNTTHLVKRDMMVQLRNLLDARKIVFDEECFTSFSSLSNIKELLRRQAKSYAEIKEAPKSLIGSVRIAWTGKASGKDDLIVALQLLVYWKNVFMSQVGKYKQFW